MHFQICQSPNESLGTGYTLGLFARLIQELNVDHDWPCLPYL